MLLGRIKERPDDPEKYSTYVAHRMKPGENNNILCIGAPGSYKSRGFIIPFLMGCAQRSNSDGGQHPESVIVTDPKGELFEMTAPYFEKNGFYVKAVNFLDMAHSDGWNCLAGLDTNPDLVTTVANTIIQNTSGPKEADDFWSRAELNLLMALIHYVCNKKDDRGNLVPLEQRSLGDVYKILAYKSVNEINRTLAELPPEHPAKGPHGLFLKARENLWGNIIIGLGNRLAVFQNPLVDKITRNHDVDLLLPGQRPCAYFVIISAQDSAYRFLSSLFFSLTFPQLSNYARLHGGRLPVLTNFCLEEYLNIGYMEGISDVFNSIRGFNMSVQVAVQSLSQWKEKYPGMEWENQLGSFDMTLYMGCNDMTSAEYFAKKCGKVTISVINNQFPLAPLFSPIYSTTRPYSQTRSNTQRDLLQPDGLLLRLDGLLHRDHVHTDARASGGHHRRDLLQGQHGHALKERRHLRVRVDLAPPHIQKLGAAGHEQGQDVPLLVVRVFAVQVLPVVLNETQPGHFVQQLLQGLAFHLRQLHQLLDGLGLADTHFQCHVRHLIGHQRIQPPVFGVVSGGLQANAVGDHAAQLQDLLPGRPVGTGDLERELFLVQGEAGRLAAVDVAHRLSPPLSAALTRDIFLS